MPHGDEDLLAVQGLAVHMVDLSIPYPTSRSNTNWAATALGVLRQINQMVRKARLLGYQVCVGMEDASRADMEFILQVAEMAAKAGAARLRFADTVGIMEPFSVHSKLSRLRANCDLELEMHAHDDFGLATANTLAAVAGGATHINTTVNGLGERAGNAPLEECVLALNTCTALIQG